MSFSSLPANVTGWAPAGIAASAPASARPASSVGRSVMNPVPLRCENSAFMRRLALARLRRGDRFAGAAEELLRARDQGLGRGIGGGDMLLHLGPAHRRDLEMRLCSRRKELLVGHRLVESVA